MNLPRSISVSHEIFCRSSSVTRDKSFRNLNVPRSISVKRERSNDKCPFVLLARDTRQTITDVNFPRSLSVLRERQ